MNLSTSLSKYTTVSRWLEVKHGSNKKEMQLAFHTFGFCVCDESDKHDLTEVGMFHGLSGCEPGLMVIAQQFVQEV